MSMQSFIPVIADKTISHEALLVDARALHRFLEVEARFNDWIARRVSEYGFQEGEDFYSVLSKSSGGRPGREYRITLDMGKELAMVERNDKGRQARRYFIECEKRLAQVAPRDAATIMNQTIGTDGFHMLGAVVKGKVASLPAIAQRRATAKIWSQTHAAFGVRSAADIPAEQLDAARNFIAAYVVLEGEYIPREPKSDRLNIHFPIQALAGRREGMLTDRGDGQAWLDVSLQDVGYHHDSLCELIIFELQKAGYVVDAAQWELATYRNKLRGIASFVSGLNRVVEDPQRYAVAGDAA